MALQKCPKCELNYIKEGQTVCDVCAKALKNADYESDADVCLNCGERPVVPGGEFCTVCLAEINKLAKDAAGPVDADHERALPDETSADEITEMEDVDLDSGDEAPFDIGQELEQDAEEEDAQEEGDVSLDAMVMDEDVYDEDEEEYI